MNKWVIRTLKAPVVWVTEWGGCAGEGATGWSERPGWGCDLWAEALEKRGSQPGMGRIRKRGNCHEPRNISDIPSNDRLILFFYSSLFLIIPVSLDSMLKTLPNFFNFTIPHFKHCVLEIIWMAHSWKQKRQVRKQKGFYPKLISNSNQFCKKFTEICLDHSIAFEKFSSEIENLDLTDAYCVKFDLDV